MFNKIRYNHWNNILNKKQRSLREKEREEILALTRIGKLSKEQCDELLDRNKELIKANWDRMTAQSIVEEVLGREYTVESWSWDEDKNGLVIYMKETARRIVVILDGGVKAVLVSGFVPKFEVDLMIRGYTADYIRGISNYV